MYHTSKYSTNEIIGVFTCHARLKLYNLFEDAGFDSVLYADADSCIYIEKNDVNDRVYKTQLGDYLGQLTDELEGMNTQLSEYVATGPNSYSLRFDDVSASTKVKGFPLSVKNVANINHDTMK
eukprot:gene12476-14742_t